MRAEDAVEHLVKSGYKASCLPVSRLKDARNDLEALLSSGALVGSFYEMHLSHFAWDRPKDFPEAESVIVVSLAQPMVRTSFAIDGEKIEALVPPTYAGSKKMIDEAKAKLETFSPGHRFEFARLPMKTLATRSGLARYGRNNITYVDGFGSFQRLTVFLTDLECASDHWSEKRMLERCEKCTTCVKMCPTRSISTERFLIHAETCLTNLNEMEADKPFPSYVRPEMHNAIVGCMVCQMKCPEDRKFVGFIEDRRGFNEEETRYLMKGDFSDERKAKEMEEKLTEVGIDLSIFPRNLVALVESEKRRAT
ncbi:MAG: 4Fe-4S double cluster binding domain-containing protein [Methanomassiliicoccales archaeon]